MMASLMYSDLSAQQQKRFEDRCVALGVDPKSVQKAVHTRDSKHGMRLGQASASAGHSPANMLTIQSVRKLKALCATQDDGFLRGTESDATVAYPPSAASLHMVPVSECGNDACKLKSRLSREQHDAVEKAFQAYIIGNSTKVRDYEDYIDTLHFPMEVAVYAAENIVISAEYPLVIDAPDGKPTMLNFGTVLVEQGGQIELHSPVQLDSQTFTTQSAELLDGDASPTINFVGANGSAGTDGTAGTAGSTGTAAQQGSSTGGKHPSCSGQVAAGAGGVGTPGGYGTPGGDGTITGTSLFQLGNVSGQISVVYKNGTGANGGNGAAGGNGGNGGAGADAAGPCGALNGGAGGNGGDGGNGGAGGKGADGPNVTIYYTGIDPSTTFTIDTSSVTGGTGGKGGAGGNAGTGGGGSVGTPGSSGAAGAAGKPGTLTTRLQAM